MEQILAACGAISIIGGAGAIIERHQINDLKRLSSIEGMQRSQSKALAALLNHQIDGNGKDKMKVIRDELLQAVIDN